MDSLQGFFDAHGLVVVYLNVLAAQLGVPLPMIPVLLVMSARSVVGTVDASLLFAVGVGACVTADSAWYVAGRRYGRGILRSVCRLSQSPESCVSQTQTLFTRWGVWTLLVAKFIPGLGPLAAALSGRTRIPLPLFVVMDALGASLFVGLAISLGRAFHTTIDGLLGSLAGLGKAGVVVAACGLLFFLGFRVVRKHWLIRSVRMTRISVGELNRLLKSGAPHAIYDVRPAARRDRDGFIPGAHAWSVGWSEVPAAASSPDVEVIFYCDCPDDYSAAKVAHRLQQAGFANVRPLLGGMDAWIAAGLPVHGGQPITSD